MFQYGRRGSLPGISFYKNLVFKRESQNGINSEEVGISQQRKLVSFQSSSIFIIYLDLLFGGIALKIAFVVFVYETIT